MPPTAAVPPQAAKLAPGEKKRVVLTNDVPAHQEYAYWVPEFGDATSNSKAAAKAASVVSPASTAPFKLPPGAPPAQRQFDGPAFRINSDDV
jgi:hypothetical protein